MQILDYFKRNKATARDEVSSRSFIEKNGTGISTNSNAAARGRSTGLLPADHLEGDFSPSIYSPDFAWSESDCKLFVQALSRCSQQEAKHLVQRVLSA